MKLLQSTSVLAMLLMAGIAAAPAQGALTPSSAFGKEPPWGRQPAAISWSHGGKRFTYVLPSQDPSEHLPLMLRRIDGAARVLLEPALFGKHGATPYNAGWSPKDRRIAVNAGGTLYVYTFATKALQKIASGVSDPQWSPNGNAIAFAKKANLYVAQLGAKIALQQITHGGTGNAILDGQLDWVYPEELGITHGFRWSPDGSKIAYLRLDERKVTRFPLTDFLPKNGRVNYQRYPLAGEKNPAASLHVIDLATKTDRLLYNAAPKDRYIAAFSWRPKSDDLITEILNRREQWLRVESLPAAGSAPSTLYRQRSPSWVDVIALPTWLPDGSSLWVLDRENLRSLYLRASDGSLRRITGDYNLGSEYATNGLVAAGKSGTRAWVYADYPTRRNRALLEVDLRSGALKDLTPERGVHRIAFAPATHAFVDTYSSMNRVPEVALHVPSQAPQILAAPDASLQSMLLPVRRFEVPSKYGALDAWMIRPPHFDPHRKYPVVVYVYGGPAAPTTTNGFGYTMELMHDLLAQEGIIVFSIDGPASQIDNDKHVRLLLHNFGPGSLAGQRIGARYLASLPYVDAKRIGIWGWSFGGYETIYALEHSKRFVAGLAVAPVTDWHLYDTIYTERYMGLPQKHPHAYDRSSNLFDVAHLNGPLQIMHGTSDDNVHMANTVAFLQKTILAGLTDVNVMLFPRKTHSIAGLMQRRTLWERMLIYWRSVLHP